MRSAILIILALGACASCSWLKPPHPPTVEERQAQFIHCFRDEFSPTDEQLKTLTEKIFKTEKTTKDIAEKLRELDHTIERRLESDAGDGELIGYFNQIADLKRQLSEDHFKRMLLLRSILTPEQRTKFGVCKRKMGPPALPHED